MRLTSHVRPHLPLLEEKKKAKKLFSLTIRESPGLLLSALPGLSLKEVEMSRSRELGKQGEEQKLSWGFRNGPFSIPK